ncbi:L-rhamnose mutarotase [Mucilaginibacter myungsuensis]|uniref:L-rhamnose mutarotase n=1 Tax=Mucilaginibacter myungsuensis TaxID=649104 RepID=A0A929KZU1_9SPHI|nr:L-rhamnose mutarotase [Mucilaginibacter myungsuensis]MBE9661575.1 L-rhamnose mutarotase [Mucilaginibacter myungsuensis]MDN3597718.1 L-rhamnose mutarotase [Mucilaginibacter myungsuensis]
MTRYTLALDLVGDLTLIAEYEAYHKKIWPEIHDSIASAGVTDMEIYRFGNRLFMIMEVYDTFSFDAKGASDAANPKVQEWEQLMWKYQQAIPGAKPGEKWVLMDRIFKL